MEIINPKVKAIQEVYAAKMARYDDRLRRQRMLITRAQNLAYRQLKEMGFDRHTIQHFLREAFTQR